jgi:uncharacterized metal-binding protein YceD (DUF177 family)
MRYRLHKLLYAPVGSKQVEHLDQGLTRFDDDLSVDYLSGELEFARLNEAILLNGQVDVQLKARCIRSLEDFDLCLSVPLEDILISLPQYPNTELDRCVSDDGWVDLTETLREEIILAIPINPINPIYADADEKDPLSDVEADNQEWLTVKWSNPAREMGDMQA